MKTTRFLLAALTLALLLGWPLARAAAINVSEANLNTDFPNSAAAVTGTFTYTLNLGTNTFSGTSGASGDAGDFFKVYVPPGFKITAISTGAIGGTFTGPTAPALPGFYTCGYTPPGIGSLSWQMNITLSVAADYEITTNGGQLVVTNAGGHGDVLTLSEPSAGNIQFAASNNRTFSVNGGVFTTGNSGTISLSGISGITVNGGDGGETINVGDFFQTSITALFPSLTINGGAGDDTVNFTGVIVVYSGRSITVNLQASGASPGVDAIHVTGGISPSGTALSAVDSGTIDLECSQSISITAGAVVRAEDGDLTVKANQQAAATGGNFTGVYVDGAGTKLQVSKDGALTVSGRGGNDPGGSQLGVNVSGGAQISGSFGAVQVSGTGGASTGSVNRGVTVYGSGSAITSSGSSVEVTGTGGPNSSAYGIGVSVLYGGKISTSTAFGSVFVKGTGAGAAGSGSDQGVEIGGVATPASTISAASQFSTVQVTGTAGPGASSGLFMSDSAAITSAGSGTVFINSDSVSLDATATISTADASSKVQISSIAAPHIDLGGADAAGTLGLSAAELARFTTPTLEIDGLANGDMTISAPLTFSNGTNLSLSPGSGGLKAAASGHDLTFPNGGTLFLNGPLTMPITGPNADSGFPQLNIGGVVNLSDATLNLAGTTAPGSSGRQYKIILNLGGAPITGTFAGLPEGALMTWPGSTGFFAQISYVGGSGHDVVLTLLSSTPNVITTNDTGAGSLRAALAVAAFRTGADTVTFDPSLSGQTIGLLSELLINDAGAVTIDASNLAAGVNITSITSRAFEVASGSQVTMRALTITNNTDATGIGGGGMLNAGLTTLVQCTLAGNQAINSMSGGNEGGALYNTGNLTLTQCTVANNSAPGLNSLGGAIYNLGTVSVVQSTIAGNSAGNGGGIVSFNPLTITNSIIAGNTLTGGGVGPDIYNNASLTKTGADIVQSAIFNNGSITGTGTIANVNPLLAPIDNYGGPTQTMALLPGSPARNAAGGSAFTSDQRGFPIVGTPDIGAYEAGTLGTNFNAYIWESLPATAIAAQHAAGVDFDGDGVSNYNEWLALTNPADNTSYFHVTNSFISNGYLNVFFPTVTGRNYTVEYATALGNPTDWNFFETVLGNGGTGASAIGPLSPGLPQIFVHIRTGP